MTQSRAKVMMGVFYCQNRYETDQPLCLLPQLAGVPRALIRLVKMPQGVVGWGHTGNRRIPALHSAKGPRITVEPRPGPDQTLRTVDNDMLGGRGGNQRDVSMTIKMGTYVVG